MQRILVTGASRGLGLEFVRQFLQRGERVFAACRKPGHATELTRLALAHPGRLSVLPLDVAKAASIVELEKEIRLGTEALDLLINNAGVLVSGERYGALEPKSVADTFATNVIGPVLVTQTVTALLAAGNAPRVMNISSILGSIARCESFGTPSYAISKAALNMATRQLSHELATRGITAFAVHPGWVKTDMGGAGAEITPQQSVAGLIALVDQATPAHAGRFFGWDGAEIPW